MKIQTPPKSKGGGFYRIIRRIIARIALVARKAVGAVSAPFAPRTGIIGFEGQTFFFGVKIVQTGGGG